VISNVELGIKNSVLEKGIHESHKKTIIQSPLSFKTFTSCPLFYFTLCNIEDFILHNGKKISINKRAQVGQ
jgi:hypothetical protein